MLKTTRERDGYDMVRRGEHGWNYLWFEAWGSGKRENWTFRDSVGRPPRPDELARADYIIIGRTYRGQTIYKTLPHGMDL